MAGRKQEPMIHFAARYFNPDHLHLGYWEPEDELTLENLFRAQDRFTEHLVSFIPEQVETILDVGGGVGGNALRLKQAGFDVEALSPDPLQREMFEEKTNGEIEYHLARFEDFRTDKRYDLVLMSESVQAIEMERGFERCREMLKDNGFLLAADFFQRGKVKKETPVVILNNANHTKEEYLNFSENYSFKLMKSEDITQKVAPTGDCLGLLYRDQAKPVLELIQAVLQWKTPMLYRVGWLILGRKVRKLLELEKLLDSQLFVAYKEYMIYLFRKVS